jgi:hypothetical protein
VVVGERRVAVPTQTTTIAASNAVATIFTCVVASARHIDEFMTSSQIIASKYSLLADTRFEMDQPRRVAATV